MEFNLFIIPATMILTEVFKQYLDTKYIPLVSVVVGLILGVAYGLYFGADLFIHGFYGLVYGATATGLYKATDDLVTK